MPVRVIVTDGTMADCSMAGKLIEEFDTDYPLADRGYDTDSVIEQAGCAKIEMDLLLCASGLFEV